MQDPASLNNLRDIVQPQPVSWWPLAAGWWCVIALIAIGIGAYVVLAWKRWRANAYRRAALSEVEAAGDDATILAILKRTAMCADSRPHVGSLSGQAWVEWLSQNAGFTVPAELAQRIASGVYQDGTIRTPALAAFAKRWIAEHQAQEGRVNS